MEERDKPGSMEPYTRIGQQIIDEVYRAVVVLGHGPMHSLHEAHSVIEEEYDEFWDEVKKNPKKHPERNRQARMELIQLAAMCIRAVHDVCDKEQ